MLMRFMINLQKINLSDGNTFSENSGHSPQMGAAPQLSETALRRGKAY